MKTRDAIRSLFSLTILCLGLWQTAAHSSGIPDDERPVVEVALVLDASGTMNQLLDAVRMALWDMVDELVRLEPTPRVRVALLTYGSSQNPADSGWVRIEMDLTEDLDRVSERLFALSGGGDTEYVARAVATALEGLSWTDSDEALKMIFVAGNEAADQDPVLRLEDAAALAQEEGVFVTAVFSTTGGEQDSPSWRRLAALAQGQYSVIGPQSAAIETPFDAQLAQLGAALNETFIPLGEAGQRRLESITLQDENALSLGERAAAGRAQVKAGSPFAGSWDLLSAVEAGLVDLAELPEDELPETVRQMSYEERVLLVEGARARREEIRASIRELADRRRLYLASEAPRIGGDSLDGIVRETVRRQAREKGLNHPDD